MVGDYIAYYDRIYGNKDYAHEATVVLDMIAAHYGKKPARLLDFGCGTGSHALRFAEMGITVTGVEREPEAVELARAKVKGRDGITFFCGDVTDLPEREFHAAVSLFNVVNYLADSSSLDAALGAIAERLVPQGVFVFDCWNGEAALRDPPRIKEDTVESGDETITVRSEPSLDPTSQSVTVENTITVNRADGSRLDISHSYDSRLWTPDQLRDALNQAGFDVVTMTAWMKPHQPADEDTWKIMTLSRKRG
ncbi:MAG: class I SAM-dependent methyltransferase [Alphaproteobacteria bacterium]|nr:class I SAM-dependent methyltransferase [Alphaproteobacteria bacterium]